MMQEPCRIRHRTSMEGEMGKVASNKAPNLEHPSD